MKEQYYIKESVLLKRICWVHDACFVWIL